MTSIIAKIKKKWQLIVYVSLILGAVTFFVSTVIPPKYKSEVSILIVQHNIDTFSAARSAGYLGDIFSQVLYTESFLNDVLESPFEIDKKFSVDPKKKRAEWKKEVSIKKIADTGIVQIRVFDVSRVQAEKISSGIAWNFAVNGTKYHGGAENIEVKIIDGPITSAKPAHPNVILNAFFGLLVGFVGSFVIVLFFDEFDLKIVESRRPSKSMVKEEIERQLEKRSQDEKFEFPPYEPEVYEIKKAVSRVDSELEQKSNVDEKASFENEVAVTQEKENNEEDEFSSEIQQKKKMVHEAVREIKPRVELEKEKDIKEFDVRPEVEDQKDGKTNFLSRLYQKSLFADKLFSKNKHLIIEEDRRHQERLDGSETDSVENVKKITSLNKQEEQQLPWMGGIRKAPAPDDLPIFVQPEDEGVEKTKETQRDAGDGDGKKEDPESFVGEEEHEKLVQEIEEAEEKIENVRNEVIDSDMEPTDDEVKDRLNKLLKGEL